MLTIDPADYDAAAKYIGRRADLTISFGPHTNFPEVYIEAVLPHNGGIQFRDYKDSALFVLSSDIESLHAYPA